MSFDLDRMTEAGFTKTLSKAQWAARNAELDALGMNTGGPYTSDYVLQNGDVTLTVEQNTSTETQSGMEVTIKHPQVVIVEGPGGRVACPAGDADLILAMTEQLAQG